MQKDSYYSRPKKAGEKLNMAWKTETPVYIYGVTGIGKTALVRDVFARRRYTYFSAADAAPEQIRVREEGKTQILVLDDLQELTEPDERKEYAKIIGELLERKDVWLVLISRAPVPGWLITLYIRYAFVTVSSEDLCFSRKETAAYLDRRGVHMESADEEKIWQLSGGHPLCIRLIAMRGGNTEGFREDLRNYLETNVCSQWDTQMQDFLMETSIVRSFTQELAGMITGSSNVAVLLQRATELGDFFASAGKDGVWEYRRQMRESMQLRLLKKYSADKVDRLYHHAGLYYEMHDQTPEALEMYEKSGDSASISRVLIANARKNPANGHYFEMRRYYLDLPEEIVKESPVLMAGMSMLQSILMNAEESEKWYSELSDYANTHTGSAAKEARGRLLYLDIGLPHRGSVKLADILKNAGAILKQKGASLPEFSVTSNLPSMMNGGKDFCEWSKKDRELAAGIGKIVEFVLGRYGKGLVPLALAESGLEKGIDNYEVMSLAEKGKLAAESGGKTEQCFVAAGMLIWLSLLGGNADYSLEQLEAFRRRAEKEAGNLLPNIDAFRCRILLYQGKYTEVMRWMETAPRETEEFATMERFRYLTKVRAYLMMGKYDPAYGLLKQLIFYAEKMKRTYISMEAGILLAVTMYRLGIEGWEEVLQKNITEAEEYHFVRLISREGAAVLKLLKKADLTWKDPAFRRQVLSECETMAEYYPRYLERTDGEIVLPENALRILRLQAEGESVKSIASKLNIAESTVKYHSKETYRKLGVNSKVAALVEAKRRGLI